MHQEQLSQVPELSNGHVGSSRGLKSFNTTNADTHMRRLDHGNIVGSIAYRQEKRFLVSLNQFDDKGLLERRNTTKGESTKPAPKHCNGLTHQQTTALQRTAKSKNNFSISFSKA